jgi:hypothetical protein
MPCDGCVGIGRPGTTWVAAPREALRHKVVSERLGRAAISITLDTYSHAIPAMQEEAAARIAAPHAGTEVLHVGDVAPFHLLPWSRLKSACASRLSRALPRDARLLTRLLRGWRRPPKSRPTRLTIRGVE